MDVRFSKLREMVKDREAWCAAVHGVAKTEAWFSNSSNSKEQQKQKNSKAEVGILLKIELSFVT